ncbi:MAG: low-specificity L-threonine aldolase [Bacteroidetes bacterium]|nr:low-specificity L-threonine aldolase [Bacteroidota bacterium]
MLDFRSDTVTKPSQGMLDAMMNAKVGDDVFGEDPTVNEFQNLLAEHFGMEAALYMPSGAMSNQIAIKVHTQPGDEIIVEEDAHIFNYETAAPAIISNVQVKTIKGVNGVLPLNELPKHIRPNIYYMPHTRLICIENTHNRCGGTIYPLNEIVNLYNFSRDENIIFHIDGARLWNAMVATGISAKQYAENCDSISVCFSKGLGAPIGSALIGKKDFIAKARKWRKILGGGMRQAGLIAAAAMYAFKNNVDRLKEDHSRAQYFANSISNLSKVSVDLESVQTNMVFINVSKTLMKTIDVVAQLKMHNCLVSVGNFDTIRVIMHLDITDQDVEKAVKIFYQLYS